MTTVRRMWIRTIEDRLSSIAWWNLFKSLMDIPRTGLESGVASWVCRETVLNRCGKDVHQKIRQKPIIVDKIVVEAKEKGTNGVVFSRLSLYKPDTSRARWGANAAKFGVDKRREEGVGSLTSPSLYSLLFSYYFLLLVFCCSPPLSLYQPLCLFCCHVVVVVGS
jgi:hypothetical protein